MSRQNLQRLKFSWLGVFICLGMAGLFAAIAPLEKKIQSAGLTFILLSLYARFMVEQPIKKSDVLFGGWMLGFIAYSFLIKYVPLPYYFFWFLYLLAVLSVFIFYLCWRNKQSSLNC
ncbi:MAG: hypothetical protein HY769_08865 [Candidatus Stahlbacteria bacterium]|nr:hypothetical protein [Candidatus Stahlbacteria bacterium]